jgi:hypothetical protein
MSKVKVRIAVAVGTDGDWNLLALRAQEESSHA